MSYVQSLRCVCCDMRSICLASGGQRLFNNIVPNYVMRHVWCDLLRTNISITWCDHTNYHRFMNWSTNHVISCNVIRILIVKFSNVTVYASEVMMSGMARTVCMETVGIHM